MSFPIRHIAILGSTGSIGVQALEVIRQHPDKFRVSALTAQNSADILIEQAVEFRPNVVVIGNEEHYGKVNDALSGEDIKVFCGSSAMSFAVEMEEVDMVLTAVVGYAGLLPAISAIKAGKHIALANKETMVVAGQLITRLAAEHKVAIIPVDSEHSAIFQCLIGEERGTVEKVILTASGGPFRRKGKEFLETVTPEQALKHPNWSMGPKITVDSASLMNKGLEVIEAKWLFDLKPEEIDVIVHPQSIIHSLVQFKDGSMKAQMGLPDMRLPIQYAIGFPVRIESEFRRFDFTEYPELTFEKPDRENFRNLDLAYEALKMGGNAACILNAANEVAVEEFLNGNIGFLEISDIIEDCLQKTPFCKQPSLDDYIQTDKEARRIAGALRQRT